MDWYDHLIGLFIFFTTLNTITVGLRVFIRTKLTKGAFGWDDIALIFTHVSSEQSLATLQISKSYLNKII